MTTTATPPDGNPGPIGWVILLLCILLVQLKGVLQ